jgi:hypothetical protein
MFAKSKRFPEGSHSNTLINLPSFITEPLLLPPPVYFSVGKDYIPGPGEYDLSSDDSSRHKRYGFLTQTNRFPENQHHGKNRKKNQLFAHF